MEKQGWYILLVEDDEEDYLLTRATLHEGLNGKIELRWEQSVETALAAIAARLPDAILADYHLNQENGLDLIRAVRARGLQLPVILLTGHGSYDLDLIAMQAGASDYIPKSEATASLLERAIRYAIERHNLIAAAQEQKELALQRAEELRAVLTELEMQRTLLNAIIANAPSGIMLVDSQQRIVLANTVAGQIYGRPIPTGQPVSSLAEAHQAAGQDPPLALCVRTGEARSNIETQIHWPDGQLRDVLVNTAALRDGHGQVIGALSVFADITEHKQAADEQRRSLAQIEVQRRLMQSREKERLLIAQELHDGPLQSLVGLTFDINALQRMTGANELAEGIRQLEFSLQAAIREIRTFAGMLRPPALTPFGLEKAIQSHLASFTNQHPEYIIHHDLAADGQRLHVDIRLALFRIYQELLKNILRHAEANEIWVSLAISPGEVELEVRDNGRGFVVPDDWVELARQGHLGLVGIQERAQSVNGVVNITSNTGQGTTVLVSVLLEG